MSKKESAAERLAKLKAEKEAAKATAANDTNIVSQLTHESAGEPDMSAIAAKLKQRQEEERTPELAGKVKYSIYVDADVAEAFQALCIKRGDQRRFANEAMRDFVLKKTRELGLDK